MEDIFKQFQDFMKDLPLTWQQQQTAQTYIEIIQTNYSDALNVGAVQQSQASLLLSRQSREAELEERVAKLKQDLAFQTQIIQDQRQMILNLEKRNNNMAASQVSDRYYNGNTTQQQTSVQSLVGGNFQSAADISSIQQSLYCTNAPVVDLSKSAVFQHSAISQHQALQQLICNVPQLVKNVEFNRLLDVIGTGQNVAFLITPAGQLVRVFEGQDQFSNLFYVYLEGGKKGYTFHDDQRSCDNMDLVLFVTEYIDTCIFKNIQLRSVYLVSNTCKEIVGKAASILTLYGNTPALQVITGFADVSLIGIDQSVVVQ